MKQFLLGTYHACCYMCHVNIYHISDITHFQCLSLWSKPSSPMLLSDKSCTLKTIYKKITSISLIVEKKTASRGIIIRQWRGNHLSYFSCFSLLFRRVVLIWMNEIAEVAMHAEARINVWVTEPWIQRCMCRWPQLCTCLQKRRVLRWQMPGLAPSLLLHQALLNEWLCNATCY